eukprot:12411748-Karenia_brevis.AAC.1
MQEPDVEQDEEPQQEDLLALSHWKVITAASHRTTKVVQHILIASQIKHKTNVFKRNNKAIHVFSPHDNFAVLRNSGNDPPLHCGVSFFI